MFQSANDFKASFNLGNLMLFKDDMKTTRSDASKPLAERARPTAFDDVFGQESIWGQGKPLRTMAMQDSFFSLIFWGPPGCGKTSIARLMSNASKSKLYPLSAVHAGVKDLRQVIEASKEALFTENKAALLFLDEVHRLSKNQQDILLPALEEGWIKFIGATTENPSFEVNSAINSRSLTFKFEKINKASLVRILERACQHESISSRFKQTLSSEVLSAIANSSDGDARRALNLLEAVFLASPNESDVIVNPTHLKDLESSLPLNYDKDGEEHYNTISAMIKSIRASHPDAAVYYLAKMLDAGEDPLFIARRLIISASEDCGNANPHALDFAVSGAQAVQMIGMPEARIILSQICCFLAASPKSNRSYRAINTALDVVKKHQGVEIPLHLRNGVTKLMKELDYGKHYIYAHDNLEGAKKLNYLPKELKNMKFYEPTSEGYEAQIQKTLSKRRPDVD